MLLPFINLFSAEAIKEAILKRCDEIVERGKQLREKRCAEACLKACCNILARKDAILIYCKNRDIFKKLATKVLLKIFDGDEKQVKQLHDIFN